MRNTNNKALICSFIYQMNDEHDFKLNLSLTFGMTNWKCINCGPIIAWQEQSLLPLLICFDRFLHIDKSRQTQQCSCHLRGAIHLPPQVYEQTLHLNAHLNGTPIIFRDKWSIQTIATTAPGCVQQQENRAKASQSISPSCSCEGTDTQTASNFAGLWYFCNKTLVIYIQN